MRTLTALIVFLYTCFNSGAQVPERFTGFVGKDRAEVMVLGVFHFGESGDSYRSERIGVLSPERQSEIESLIESIAHFRPTKILVEFDRLRLDSLLTEQYRGYLAGNFDISQRENEVYQLAFRLGKRLGHDKIYCSDADAPWFGTDDIDWDDFDEDAYLDSRGQLEKSTRYDYEAFYEYSDSLKVDLPIDEYLRFLNSPEVSLKYHQVYLTDYALAGAGDNYYGADSAGKWYRRNLRIFANLYDLAELEGPERILMIYGTSHIWTLRQFIGDSPDFIYVPANDYLCR